MTFEQLLLSLPKRPDVEAIATGFVPPPRFRDASFENYRPQHPSQADAVGRLRELASRLATPTRRPGLVGRILNRGNGHGGGGIYLDGGFGVGKTHLLAAFWHSVSEPRIFLSFDELMYFVGIAGAEGAASALGGARLVAIDEWELDDPGNLKMALAVVRRLLAGGAFVATTSNTLPLDLGIGRFSQKDFRAEIEELAGAFQVVTIQGDDFRHRHFHLGGAGERNTGQDSPLALQEGAQRVCRTRFADLLVALSSIHPIRYGEIARRIDVVIVEGLDEVPTLSDALRWVHFVDSVYDGNVLLAVTDQRVSLAELFNRDMLRGPFAKKLGRCLSRMEELVRNDLVMPTSTPFDETPGSHTS